MSTLSAALGGFHHRLEQRAEDGRRNRGPVEQASVNQALAHFSVKIGDAQRCGEQRAVDIREARQVLVELGLPPIFRRVQNLKQPRQIGAEVAAVG